MSDETALTYFAIVGVGRSGTTLLMSMLNAHPAITLPPEFHFVNEHLAQRPRATLAEALARLEGDPRFARLGLALDEVKRPFTHLPFSMPNLYRQLLQCYAQKQGVSVIGDKAPKYVEYLPLLRHIFPDAKIIHLIRDPRDVYLSRTKAAWSAGRKDTWQFLAYRAQSALGRRLGPKLFGHNYLEVHYEQLLTQPQNELQRICRLIGAPYQPEMLAFGDAAQNIIFPDELAWKREALGPLLTDNMNKWRRELTPQQVARVEAACAPAFKEGFYQPAVPPKPTPARIMMNSYMAALSAIYQSRIALQNRRVLRQIKS